MEEMQSRAFTAGGFGAMAACLRQQQALVSAAFGGVHRRLLLEAVCLMSTAFDLGPSRLGGDTFGQLLGLIKAIVAGEGRAMGVWGSPSLLPDPTPPCIVGDLARLCALVFTSFPGCR